MTAPRTSLAIVVALLSGLALPAQEKRAITHDDYDHWTSMRGTSYSADGKWMTYSVSTARSDSTLHVKEVDGKKSYTYPLASGAGFTSDSRYLIFKFGTSRVEAREKKIAEFIRKNKSKSSGKKSKSKSAGKKKPDPAEEAAKKAEKERRSTIHVLELATGKIEKIKRVKAHRAVSDAPYLIYQLEKPEPPKKAEAPKKKGDEAAKGKKGEKSKAEGKGAMPKKSAPKETAKSETPKVTWEMVKGEQIVLTATPAAGAPTKTAEEVLKAAAKKVQGKKEKKEEEKKKTDPLEKKRRDGTELVVRNVETGVETRYQDVVSYGLTRKSTWLYYQTSSKKLKKGVTYGLFAIRMKSGDKVTLAEGTANYSGFTYDRDQTKFVFASDLATFADEKPKTDIYLWDFTRKPARRILHRGTAGFPEGMSLSGRASFTRDYSGLTFSVRAPREDKPKPPALMDEEKIVLDIWHWNDGSIQTQQARGGRGRFGSSSTRSCLYYLDDDRVYVIGSKEMPRVSLITPDGSRGLYTDSEPYRKLVTWDSSYSDVYLVNTIDGSRTKLFEKMRSRPSASPTGRYLIWWEDPHWHVMDVQTRTKRNLTDGLPVSFARETDDRPQPKGSHGVVGWTKDDKEIVLNDEFDLWRISVDTGDAVCITDGVGRDTKIRLRYMRMRMNPDDTSRHMPEELWLTANNTETIATGIYKDTLTGKGKPTRVVMMDKSLGRLTKPRNADRFFFTIQTWSEFPEIWTAKLDLTGMRKLTNVGIANEKWKKGKAELVKWTSLNGAPLKGILIKPDNFDPKKKYPMMVHFYERSSSGLHRYGRPSAGTSPNAAYYVSNGYLWFNPDIVYRRGYPGPSCLNCVVSGVQHLVNQGFVDRKGIGASGHSWGGYQTAYLVTRTDIFAAVESGAPVSNMVSAYGGIRWGSGRSRQFQYERTQSRIGGSPWQYPMRYWENSPIYFADKVNTPVLILHNDQDGAVPWYQGIEYFMALRRLGKEAYMFNYVGGGHGLSKRQDRMDWTRRMQEYFDHHLRGRPAPKWMTDGVPYSERESEKLQYIKRLQQPGTVEAASGDTRPGQRE